MTVQFGNPDRPNSYIGKTVPRPNAARLVEGRGKYVDDIVLPRMVHVAFVRSPFAHAKIEEIETSDAAAVKGVVRVFTGADLAEVCTPWVAVLAHLKGLKSPPEHPMAVDRACWVGEPVVAVVATSRAAAEDGAELVEVDYEQLPVVTDMMSALDPDTPVLHPEMGDNLAFQRVNEEGDIDAAFAGAHKVVSAQFSTARHTGVTLEPRSILVDWNPAETQMTAYHATQAPHMMQTVLAKHLDRARRLINQRGDNPNRSGFAGTIRA